MPDIHPSVALPPRFTFRPDKASEAIDLIARARPGITQYFIGKLLYLADKAHFLDWGRPITFDRYVAMVHGPVPSAVRNMLAAAADVEAGMDGGRLAVARQHADVLNQRVRVELELALNGERQCVYPLENPKSYYDLSGSDIEVLDAVVANWRQASTRLWPAFASAPEQIVLLPHGRGSRKSRELRYRIAATGPAAILNYLVMTLLRQNSEFGRTLARCRHCQRFFLAWRDPRKPKGKLNRRWCKECHRTGEGHREWETQRKRLQRAKPK